MKLRFLTMIAVLAIIVATPAFALDLQGARSAGIVGEQMDGYVAVLKPSADAEVLVNGVNARRKAEYSKISQQNSQPLAVVAKLAAEEIIHGLPAGSFYQAADGSWKKK